MKLPFRIGLFPGSLCLILIGLLLFSRPLFAQDDETPGQQGTADVQNGDYDQALDKFNQAIASNPQDAQAYFSRAYVYVKMSEDDKAVADLTQAIAINPAYTQAYYRRSFIYMIRGNYDAATADLNRVIAINPQFKKAYFRRACIEMIGNKDDLALADLDKVIQIDPNFDQAYVRRSYAFMLKGDYAQAITAMNEILAKNPQASGTYNRLAWLQATCPDASFRDGKKAVDNATTACTLTGWQISAQLDTLAAAYAESSDFANAIKWENKAMSLQKDHDLNAGQIRRLMLYQSYQPYHVKKYDPKFEAVIL